MTAIDAIAQRRDSFTMMKRPSLSPVIFDGVVQRVLPVAADIGPRRLRLPGRTQVSSPHIAGARLSRLADYRRMLGAWPQPAEWRDDGFASAGWRDMPYISKRDDAFSSCHNIEVNIAAALFLVMRRIISFAFDKSPRNYSLFNIGRQLLSRNAKSAWPIFLAQADFTDSSPYCHASCVILHSRFLLCWRHTS